MTTASERATAPGRIADGLAAADPSVFLAPGTSVRDDPEIDLR